MANYERQYSNPIIWENYTSTKTPISANNLNKMDGALVNIDMEAANAINSKANQEDFLKAVTNVTYDSNTGIFSITFADGHISIIDTTLEKVVINFAYNSETQSLDLTYEDGRVENISLNEFVTQYEFNTSDEISFTNDKGLIEANIRKGSISIDKLTPDIQNTISDYTTQAKIFANIAQSYANGTAVDDNGNDFRIHQDIDNAQHYSERSNQFADTSEKWSKIAQSWTEGGVTNEDGTPVRDGQETDSAKYYAELAAKNGESWTHGGVKNADGSDFREGQDTDSAEYWAKQAQAIVGISVDKDLSETSNNPVQNKAIASVVLPLIETVNNLKKSLNEMINTGHVTAKVSTGNGILLKTGDGKYITAKVKIGECNCNNT